MRLALLILTVGTLYAQSGLEVATIKLAEPGNIKGYRGGCRGVDSKSTGDNANIPIGRCLITDARLSHMITMAWNMKTISIIQNAPDWVISTDERYNVQAKAEDPKATEAQLFEMLRALLVDGFS